MVGLAEWNYNGCAANLLAMLRSQTPSAVRYT